MSVSNCACGMSYVSVEGQPRPFSAEWHDLHELRHLVAFPDADQTTRRNLAHAALIAEVAMLKTIIRKVQECYGDSTSTLSREEAVIVWAIEREKTVT